MGVRDPREIDDALWRSTREGHFDIVKILKPLSTPDGRSEAIREATRRNYINIIKLLK